MLQILLKFDNNRIFDIFFILYCTEVPRLVETHLWLVKPEHVLAIWLLSSKVKFEPCGILSMLLLCMQLKTLFGSLSCHVYCHLLKS